MRLLATQFKNEREDQDCDTKARILQHAQAIHKLLDKKAFNLKDHLEKLKMKIFPNKEADTSKKNPLPVTEKEMIDLEDRLLRYAERTKKPMTLSLEVNDESTCWNNLLTQEQKDNNVTFIRKCGECSFYHEFPKCDRCKTPRRQIGPCLSCKFDNPKEGEPYKGYCGNCFKIHELTNCVECQHYRIKPGRCTICGAVGPDDTEWTYTCLHQDEQYEPMMEYILERRRKTIEKQKQKYTTYKECPLCDGHFHSAKACLFRKHAKYINILHKKIKVSAAMSDSLTITGKLLLDKPDSEDEDSSDEEDEEEEEGSDEEDSSDQNYMVIIHHEPAPLDEEDSSSDEGEYDLQEEQPITAFDKILEAIISIQTKKIQEDTHEDQWGEPGEGNEDNSPQKLQLELLKQTLAMVNCHQHLKMPRSS